ncbi:MAG: hypothetical protein K9I34_00165 [Bacteroidales bacterium]|nr:hypothetical protein [Bacteroidales bacterium]
MNREAIHINNYEAWLLDYLEGNLNPSEIRMVQLFLADNPVVREEFLGMQQADDIALTPDPVTFAGKAELKKPDILSETEISYEDELAIKILEKDASPKEIDEFNRLSSKSKAYRQKAGRFLSLRLTPDTSQLFPLKSGLKRYTLIPISKSRMMQFSAVAATLAVLLFAADIFVETLPVESHQAIQPTHIQESIVNPAPELASQESFKNPAPELAATEIVKPNSNVTTNGHTSENQIASVVHTPQPDIQTMSVNVEKLSSRKIQAIQDVYGRKEFHAGLLSEIVPDFAYFPADEIIESEPISLQEFLISRFKKTILGKQVDEVNSTSLKAYEVADAGLNQLDKLVGKNFSWKAQRDEKGSLISYNLKTPLFEISKGKE